MEDYGTMIELDAFECYALDVDGISSIYKRDYETVESLYFQVQRRFQTVTDQRRQILQSLIRDLKPIHSELTASVQASHVVSPEHAYHTFSKSGCLTPNHIGHVTLRGVHQRRPDCS